MAFDPHTLHQPSSLPDRDRRARRRKGCSQFLESMRARSMQNLRSLRRKRASGRVNRKRNAIGGQRAEGRGQRAEGRGRPPVGRLNR
jgi:hypothetical protein